MGPTELDNLNLSERGEVPATGTRAGSLASTCPTLQGTGVSCPEGEENKDEALGRAKCALYKELCQEWCFFPALQAQFSLALDYWAAKVLGTFRDIKSLERENHAQGCHDYKEHRPDNEYGKKKEELAIRLTNELKEFSTLFNSANVIMHQHTPNGSMVSEYRLWSSNVVGSDSSDRELFAENYRALGPRPSMIDEFVHSVVKTSAMLWIRFRSYAACLRSTKDCSPGPVSIILSYTTLHVLSHLLVVVMAGVFFVLPLTMMYLVTMKKAEIVLVTITFSLLFCVGSFYFGGGRGGLKTDTKFLLLFAYTSVMATLLSNFAPHQEQQHSQQCSCPESS
ncbi:Putative protein of unknown function [Podospora comata]|uniref:DUF6594 domain-containing protein n=1 Tax=Podospora comata TaxID=48703 RepID=A0ABY6SGA1_PODCO|nr:Putative protein of unknown function [Podospora comata]